MHFKKKEHSIFLIASFVAILAVCSLTPLIVVQATQGSVSEASLHSQYTDGTKDFLVRDYVDENAQAELAAKREEEAKKVEEEAARKAEEEAAQQVAYDESYEDNSSYSESYNESYYGDSSGGGVLTRSGGVNYYNGNMETWYSQKVLPGGGLDIPGRHVAEDGTIRDADGYIVVASDNYGYGSTVETSLGTGKVYDNGVGHDGWDIYTDW